MIVLTTAAKGTSPSNGRQCLKRREDITKLYRALEADLKSKSSKWEKLDWDKAGTMTQQSRGSRNEMRILGQRIQRILGHKLAPDVFH